jgi:hypothetical protein
VLLLAHVVAIIGIAASFVLGILWPHRRHLSASFALAVVLVAFCTAGGDWRDFIPVGLGGSLAAILVFRIVTDLGLATGLVLVKVGLLPRRRRFGKFKRPDREDDRIALFFAIALYCLPLHAWFTDPRPTWLVDSAVLGFIYGTWSLRTWRRLRPICLRLRERRKPRPIFTPHCAGCGYDLTGNESGRCPECGKRIEHALRGRLLTKGAATAQPIPQRTVPVE